MAAEDNFIVAIVLGSSKITAVAGRKQPDGIIKVLAYAQEPSGTFIRKGRINNVTKTKQCIINMKEKLEKILNKSINCTYVGIGGMGMHTIGNTISRHFNEKTVISQDLVDSMLNDNKASATQERNIFKVVPQEFKIGTQFPIDPIGIQAEAIEGRYLNIVANGSIREDLETCFRNAGLNIAATPISVLTLSDTVLSESEKRSGCVFVDMGSETTSVAVFKNNILRHFAVIPLGSANVNRDIMTHTQIEEQEAEDLKFQYGSALYECDLENQNPIKLKDSRQLKFEEFAGLVEARMEEIILNIAHQIELSKYDQSQLIGGIVVTGGGANMKNIDKAFEQHTHFEKLRFVTKGSFRMQTRSSNEFNKDGSFNTALAIIDKGDFNCCGGELGNANPTLFGDEIAPVENKFNTTAGNPSTTQSNSVAEPVSEPKDSNEEMEETVDEKPKKQRKGWFKKTINSIKVFATNIVSDEDTMDANSDKEGDK